MCVCTNRSRECDFCNFLTYLLTVVVEEEEEEEEEVVAVDDINNE